MGCDPVATACSSLAVSFNPRTHMGCDTTQKRIQLARDSFNPRTHMGCDNLCRLPLSLVLRFQSTHPHGVRHFSGLVTARLTDSFNPRTHMGCDVIFFFHLTFDDLFQSTHPHGVRPERRKNLSSP